MRIGGRIKEERKKLEMTLQELSNEVGFKNYQTLSSIEKGERQIRVSELDKIAKVLGLTVSYLLGEEKERKEKVLWRKCVDESQCKKYENLLISICRNYQKLADLIGHKYEKFVPPKPEELQKGRFKNDYDFAKDLAEKYSRLLDLGRFPGKNIVDSLQDKNILIFCYDLETGSAASLVEDFGAAILLNKNDRPWRRTFDIAHELFHLITWYVYPPESVYDNEEKGKSKPEQYADTFASTLLMPEKSLKDEITWRKRERDLSLIDYVEIAAKFRISIQALTWRLQNLRLIDEELMDKIRNLPEISKLNELMRTKEPDIPELPEIYVNQALKTYLNGRISKLKLADYLNVKYGEMASFLSEYSYPDIEELNFESISP